MNIDIYNKDVASFQLKINSLEKDIMNGTLKIESIDDFRRLYEQVDGYLKEYTEIYNRIPNSVTQKKLVEFLENENDFLVLFVELLNHLNRYYQEGKFFDTYEIQKEWEDVKTIIEYHHINRNMDSSIIHSNQKTIEDLQKLESQMDEKQKLSDEALKRIENLNEQNPWKTEALKEFYKKDQEKIQSVQEKLKKQANEAFKAIDSLYNAFVSEEEIKEEAKEELIEEAPLQIDTKDLRLDEAYLNSLSYPLKMDYLKLLLENLEKVKGKKVRLKFRGEVKTIARSVEGKWLKCQSKLTEIKREYEEVLKEEQEEISTQKEEEYALLYQKFKTTEKELFTLTDASLSRLNTTDVVAVATFNKEPLYVLKTDLEKFNKLFVSYKQEQHALSAYAKENDIDILDSEKKIENLEILQNELYGDIRALQQETPNTERQEKIKELKKKLYRLNKGKRFALKANIKVFLKTLSISSDIKSYLEQVIEEPNTLTTINALTEEEKVQYAQSLLQEADAYIEKETKEPTSLLKEQMEKVKEKVNAMPKKNAWKQKIKEVKESKNKKALQIAISSAAVFSAVALGITAFTAQKDTPIKNTKSIETTYEFHNNLADLTKEEKQVNATLKEASITDLTDLFANQKEEDETKSTTVVEDSTQKNKEQTTKLEEEIKQSLEESIPTYYDFGDTFKTDGPVYETAFDVAHQQNEKSPYFDNESLHEIEGIVYEYNGEIITIKNTEKDAEATKTALENNGAKQVGFLTKNENSHSSGYEGYFSNQEDLQRGGR